jgi:hypothetical protein
MEDHPMARRRPSEVRRLDQKWGLHQFMGPEHEALLMPGETLSDLRKPDLDTLVEIVFGRALPDPPDYAPRG